MSKTNKPKNLRGETLEKAVREVVAAMQLDTEVTPAQMNMAEIAMSVGSPWFTGSSKNSDGTG